MSLAQSADFENVRCAMAEETLSRVGHGKIPPLKME